MGNGVGDLDTGFVAGDAAVQADYPELAPLIGAEIN